MDSSFVRISVTTLKLGLHGAVLGQQGIIVGTAELRCHMLQFGFQTAQVLEPFQHRLPNADVRDRSPRILRQITDVQVALLMHLAWRI